MSARRIITLLATGTALLTITACGARRPVAPPSGQPLAKISIPAFYSAPFTPGRPGQLIHAESLPVSGPVQAWRILYHSTSVTGTDIAVSGLVVAPVTAAPRGGRPVIAWAHGTTGSGDSCAPSVQPNPVSTIEDGAPLLRQGYVIAATDYPGLGTPGPHPYLVGDSEARAVLDAVRAARQIPAAQASRRVVGWGHSEGGQAVLAAAQIAPAYAPDLDLLGTVAAAPAANVPALLASITTTTDYGTGYLVLAASGYDAIDPRARIASIMTPAGAARLASVERGCDTTGDVFTLYNRLTISQAFRRNPLTTAPWSTGFARDSAGDSPAASPILVVQGDQDTSVPRPITDILVRQLRSMHDDVTYRTYPGANHDQVVQAAQAEIVLWIEQRIGQGHSPGHR
jgi:alpha-beta hydrolase superfamily lysophospholipase